jgi:hypothetical protein
MSANWKIDWYVCRADAADVIAKSAKRVGEELWRVPKSIGPLGVDHNHWAGDYIDCTPEEATLASAAPKLFAALEHMVAMYTQLINSGDCGNWDPETDKEVIAARKAIKAAKL